MQPYKISEVYENYEKMINDNEKNYVDYKRPDKEILGDLQIIHDTLNKPEFVNSYFQDVDDFVYKKVSESEGKVTPMEALSEKLRKDLGIKTVLKLYESVPNDPGFLKVAEAGPFLDVSAGLFHGEYEHLLQLAMVKKMYESDKSGLQKSLGEAWSAMFAPEHIVKLDEKDDLTHLSLWSIVMDIQGNFIYGKDRMNSGINPLFKDDQYKGIYGTSATLLHHAFGAWDKGDYSSQKIEPGMLAKKFPHLAEAIVNRSLKRKSESGYKKENKFKGYPNFYMTVVHDDKQKNDRKKEAREIVENAGGKLGKDFDYTVRKSTKTKGSQDPRKNYSKEY